jgi:prepilin-type N-terminal cleavage/methylation domain-containing protein
MFLKNLNKGFTLAEMLVSVSIITIIMGTVFFNYSTFNDKLALSAGAQEVAIAIRQAQTYGLTVKEVSLSSGQFSAGYGMHFDPTAFPATYIIFADKNADKIYNPASGCGTVGTECIQSFSLRNGVKITSICDGAACPPATARSLDVTFLRPNPDANINFMNSSGGIIGTPSLGKVVLTSPKGNTLTVTVDATGQVSIQ